MAIMRKILEDTDITQRILACMDKTVRSKIHNTEVFETLASTNDYLMQKPATAGGFDLCFARRQANGKGRYGHQWHSPIGGVYSSLRLQCNLSNIDWLGLVIASELVERLRKFGAKGVGIKWPNDIYCPYGKLGGLLIERKGQSVVVGVGLNRTCPQSNECLHSAGLDQVLGLVEYEVIAGLVAQALICGVETFLKQEQSHFMQCYQKCDFLADKTIEFIVADQRLQGVAQGITPSADLCIMHDGSIHIYRVDEVKIVQKHLISV